MSENKNITIVKPGAGDGAGSEAYDVTIQPGITCSQALESVGINGNYLLTKGDGNETIQLSDELFNRVNNGEKLFVTTEASFGEMSG